MYNGTELSDYDSVSLYQISSHSTIQSVLLLQVNDPVTPSIPDHILVNRYKHRIMEILTLGRVQICPTCNKPGIKDQNCTHIRCQCDVPWCYYCCKPDNQHPTPTNCPLFLHNITFLIDEKLIDSGPHETKSLSSAVFHRLKSIRLLHEVYIKEPEKFRQAFYQLDEQVLIVEEEVDENFWNKGTLKLKKIEFAEVENYKDFEAAFKEKYFPKIHNLP